MPSAHNRLVIEMGPVRSETPSLPIEVLSRTDHYTARLTTKPFARGNVPARRRGATNRCWLCGPNSRAAGVVSMRFNARGPNYATVSACATSAHAIGDAFRCIQYGDADIIITGGAEATVTPMAIQMFNGPPRVLRVPRVPWLPRVPRERRMLPRA